MLWLIRWFLNYFGRLLRLHEFYGIWWRNRNYLRFGLSRFFKTWFKFGVGLFWLLLFFFFNCWLYLPLSEGNFFLISWSGQKELNRLLLIIICSSLSLRRWLYLLLLDFFLLAGCIWRCLNLPSLNFLKWF